MSCILPGSASGSANWSFLTRLKLTPELTQVPAILCVAASQTVLEPAMASGLKRLGVRIVHKPFALDDLLTAVSDDLTTQRLQSQIQQRQEDASRSAADASTPGVVLPAESV